MYLRHQILDTETGSAVAAVVVPANAVTEATALRWAHLLAQDADNAVGVKGAHKVAPLQRVTSYDKALQKLVGVRPGMGGNRTGPKPRGQCAHCGGIYPLDKAGLISVHGKQYGTRSAKRCAGSKHKPNATPAGAKVKLLTGV